MKDDEFVRMVQGYMKSIGVYSGETDGDAGPKTVMAFQILTKGIEIVVPPKEILLPRDLDDIPDSGDAKLVGLHEDLVRVLRETSLRCDAPFTIIEGMRSKERQAKLVAAGASKTKNSRHLTGHAADVWPLDEAGKPFPAGTKEAEAKLWEALRKIAAIAKEVAKELGVELEWGGDWGWDGPHFQLSRKAYP